MRRLLLAAVVLLVTAAPASAAPGFTPSFRVAGAGATPVMAPDGTVVFPTYATVNAEIRTAVQIRPPGGPLGDVKLLSDPGTNGSGAAVGVGGDGRFVVAWLAGGDVKVATLMPGSTDFTPTATLTDDTADGVDVKMDGAGNAYVIWTTRDDVGMALDRRVRVRMTTIHAAGGSPTTELLDELTTASGVHPTLFVAFDVNAAGDAVFVKFRSTTDTTTFATQEDYYGWTRPAGGADTTPVHLDTASRAQLNPQTNGEARLTGIRVDLNDAGDLEASWYRGSVPFNTSTINVVVGDMASGFGPIEHPPLDINKLWSTTIPTVLDTNGRLAIALHALDSGNKVRQQLFTRSPAGTWSAGQTPLPTGDQASSTEFAPDPAGRVMAVLETASSTGSVYTALAEPGSADFGPVMPLASGLDSLQRGSADFGASGDGVVVWSYTSGTDAVTDAVGYDASPPALRNVVIPTSGTAASPLDFSVQPFDIWSPVTTTWNFDGVTSDGASQSHVFGEAGDKAVSVTATDALGNASSASGTTAIAAQPVVPGPVPATPDTTKPVASSFAASPSTFAVGPKSTPLVAKVARGTTLKFQLSEAGSVTIAIARQLPGKRSGKRCAPPSKKLRKKKSCKRYRTVGTLKRSGVAGANKVAFSGRLGKKALALGRYRATIVATDAAGNKSTAKTASFRIVKFR